jgi:hypothetical protein
MNITLGLIVSYVVGVPLALLGLLLTIQTPLGLVPLLAGVLIIPVVRRQLAARTGVEFSRGAAAGIGTFGVIAFVVVLVIVGLSSGGGAGGGPGADVSNVSVRAEDTTPPNASTTLSVEWNSRAQSAVDPDPDDFSTYRSDEGQKFVVIRVRVTNDGGGSVELTPRMFRLQSSGVEYEYQALFGSGNSLSGVTVNPGGTHSAWAAFSVPEDMTEARLIVYQDAFYRQNVSVSFTHNEQMPVEMDD